MHYRKAHDIFSCFLLRIICYATNNHWRIISIWSVSNLEVFISLPMGYHFNYTALFIYASLHFNIVATLNTIIRLPICAHPLVYLRCWWSAILRPFSFLQQKKKMARRVTARPRSSPRPSCGCSHAPLGTAEKTLNKQKNVQDTKASLSCKHSILISCIFYYLHHAIFYLFGRWKAFAVSQLFLIVVKSSRCFPALLDCSATKLCISQRWSYLLSTVLGIKLEI